MCLWDLGAPIVLELEGVPINVTMDKMERFWCMKDVVDNFFCDCISKDTLFSTKRRNIFID